jgi:Aerotolerance regulator N-terminal/von Willebrand factor type A domain
VSLLTPLYVLGLMAISLPVVFHLIRRMPKGEFPFSSLMFLSPSPPRLTRRSRLEHWLLLLLRALAIGLLAFAFARPFWRQTTPANPVDGDARRLAVLLDTSASMKRGDLWEQANRQVDAVLDEVRPHDQLAVYTCDDTLRPLVGFEEIAQIPTTERAAFVERKLGELSPTWAGTQLGRGLMDLVEIVGNVPDANGKSAKIAQQIVLVSDLQEGGRMDVLADYPWPDDVRLELRSVKPRQPTNAGLHRLAERSAEESADKPRELRVRVSNDAASAVDQFQLAWLGENDKQISEPVAAYVPVGESRVVRVPRPAGAMAAQRLRLTGDDCEFDNTLYLASRPQAEISVVYLGADEADNPQQPRYYLERALANSLSRPVELVTTKSDDPLSLESSTATPLVVVTSEPEEKRVGELKKYIEAGGTLLVVLKEDGKQEKSVAALLGFSELDISEADVGKYAMLGQIAFDHPLFAPMAGPHFNDFTQIHFWKYRKLKSAQLGDATIVARFENGDPALVERRLGKGNVYVLTSGWQPTDSQLARSWKFVLLVSALVEGRRAGKSDRAYFVVDEPVPLGEDSKFAGVRAITKPNGAKVMLAADAREFRGADEPGLYTIQTRSQVFPKLDGSNVEANASAGFGETGLQDTFAVNLDPAESRTSPLAVETLEQLGCRLVSPTAVAENRERDEQLRDVQLESRQKLWQWLVVAALGVLVTETWLAGRMTKQSQAKPVTA